MHRKLGVALAALLVVPLAGGVAALAAVPGGVPGPGLAEVGPVSATDGFPVWYKDKNGLRLEGCIAQADPLCPARGPLPDETKPVSFPDNYPDESFYSLTAANLNTGNAGKALGAVALESAFRSGPVVPGDQITFARVRIKITNARDGVDYKITLPTGTKTLQTNGKVPGLLFDTEDIGIGGPGDFSGALGGRVGPFLTWDTFGNKTDPALKADTYVGDGATLHKIKGSPFGTNVFRIEGPGINPTGLDACPTVAGAVSDCVETDLFSVQGKVATTSGVSPELATYSRSAGSSGLVDVYASSDPAGTESIQVSDTTPGGPEFNTTALVGEVGHYFARVAYTGANPPKTLQVSNVSDVPVTNKTISVVDRLTGTATYDTDAKTLQVTAGSSDTGQPPVLTATGYGPLAAGSLTVANVGAPPVSVVVTSTAGGSVTLPVQVNGSARAPIPVAAQAGPDQAVQPGQVVTLDGSASSGSISTYAWTSPAGINLTNPDQAKPTFTAPSTPGDYTFTLTVNGPGGPSSSTVTVTVLPQAASVTANAGAAQTVQRGRVVTLDGSGSTGAASYSWIQLVTPGDPLVTLNGATTARPTFTFPMYKAPANNGPLKFRLTVNNVAANSPQTADVTITPTADGVAVTAARFTSGKWRVDGTSTILAGQTVTAHLGSLAGTVIGTAVVDPTGAYSVRPPTGPTPAAGAVVVVESTLGGVSPAFTVRIG